MGKVYFRYGTMNSGKSIDLLKVAHNYEEQGRHVLIFSPAIDTRSPKDVVASRIGISHKAVPVFENTDMIKAEAEYQKTIPGEDVACILVDEAQFLTPKQVSELCILADFADIPVIAYGLKTDFKGNLFEGSKRLIELADKIEEIKTTCKCGRKALFNARYVNGKITTVGNQVEIGGNEMYKPLCRKCYVEEQAKQRGVNFSNKDSTPSQFFKKAIEVNCEDE